MRNKEDVEFIKKAAVLVSRKHSVYSGIPFYLVSLAQQNEKKDCDSEEVWDALEAGLGLPSHHQHFKDTRTIITDYCWDHVKETLVEYLGADNNSLYATNLCGILSEKNAVSNARLKKAGCE